MTNSDGSTEAGSLVFVVGPGRSGTSSMAGVLAHSGYHVPKAIKGNATNPSGFYEPRWVVDFHRELLGRRHVRGLDSDPTALAHLEPVLADPKVRDTLRTWLAERLAENSRLVIKDPRMVWFSDLWVEVSRDLGIDPGFVIMLRHPAEVASSRNTYYDFSVVQAVAGWVNVALMTERLTADSPRCLVRYPDLLTDWRRELVRMQEAIGLSLESAPDGESHPVDEFIDPSLRRMSSGWADEVPPYLRDLGDRTYTALGDMADGKATAESAGLVGLSEEYARLHADSLALTSSAVTRTVGRAKGRAAARARKDVERPPPPQPGLATRLRGAVRRVVRRS